MTLVHVVGVRNQLADLIDTIINTGGGANGTLELRTAAEAVVATLDFADPAFGAAAAGIITAGTIADDTNATGNASAVTQFVIFDKADVEVLRGSVTITSGGGDIELSAVIIGAGSTVSMTSLTYAASA